MDRRTENGGRLFVARMLAICFVCLQFALHDAPAVAAVQDEAVPTGNVSPSVRPFDRFGTDEEDFTADVAIAADGTIVTVGSLYPGVDYGFWVRASTADGEEAWADLVDGPGEERASAVAIGPDGSVVLAGYAATALPGQIHAGQYDGFVRVYEPDGAVRWTDQFGTPHRDLTTSVTVTQNGTVHVVGTTDGVLAPGGGGGRDGFIRHYSGTGEVLSTTQFGAASVDTADAVAAVGNRVVVAGTTGGALAGPPPYSLAAGFVRMLDSSGAVEWTQQWATAGADVRVGDATVADDGRIYVAGYTSPAPPSTGVGDVADPDAYVVSFSPSGRQRWIDQFGTYAYDDAWAVAVDARGTVFVAGSTMGGFPGQVDFGRGFRGDDAYVRALTAAGEALWTHQFGTFGDVATGLAVDPAGEIVAAGWGGGIPGTDAFLARVGPDCTTPTLVGTPGDDVLTGTSGPDVIVAGAGDDVIDGGGGADVICAGPGDDEVQAGDGSDRVHGGDGHDRLLGGRGHDDLEGGQGDDVIDGGDGHDELHGDAGDDVIDGGDGHDALSGGAGSDTFRAGRGRDSLFGGAGDERMWADGGADRMQGGIGDDLLNGGFGIDLISGGPGRDRLVGSGENDTLRGGLDDDVLTGGKGGDGLSGGPGNDVLSGGDNDDGLGGGPGTDICDGGRGRDSFSGCEQVIDTPAQTG